ncbi:MAG: 1-deoxy-D-xylulose-5-phosphate synthase [Bacilli bacterium]|nr:1-deoxy-D-xylulose-5-phosphate synthase [Bacilli bacterium]
MKKEPKRINLKEIENPEFLKTLSYSELNLLSADLRQYIIDVVSENGGHLSSNLGAVESTIALCRSFDFSKDKIIFDVGHQCYTYKILTGRDFENIRKKDGPSGFPKRNESIYDCYECGHSSTSISAAMGIAEARDLKKENYQVVAFIGDASFENGLVFEALDHLKKLRTKIIIVVNDNEMSIGKNSESIFSKVFRNLSNSKTYQGSKSVIKRSFGSSKFGRAILKPLAAFKHWLKHRLIAFNIFDVFNIKYIGNIDGHNIKAMEKAFKRAKAFNEPVVIHIKTVKGKGFEYTEKDVNGAYHGVGKFDKVTGDIKTDESLTSWSKEYSDRLYEIMKTNENTVAICPATSLGSSLFNIQKDFKNRFFDVGIAEEHATILAAGLSSNGVHPFVSMYSTFLQRSYDQISHDLARMNLSTTLLIDRAGLVGNDGDTHQGIYDASFLYTIPNCTIAMASSPSQINSLLTESIKKHGVFAIRYSKEKLAKEENIVDEEIKYGEWKGLLKGENTAIISYGPIVKKLVEEIKNRKLNVSVIEAIYTRPILESNLTGLNRYSKIVIYDAYSTNVGFANSLTKSLVKTGYKGEIIIKAIPNEFINHATIEEQREQLGISIDKIIDIL